MAYYTKREYFYFGKLKKTDFISNIIHNIFWKAVFQDLFHLFL